MNPPARTEPMMLLDTEGLAAALYSASYFHEGQPNSDAELMRDAATRLRELERAAKEAARPAGEEPKVYLCPHCGTGMEGDALREDAERYQYAKENLSIGVCKFDDFEDWDDARIDASRKAGQEGG